MALPSPAQNTHFPGGGVTWVPAAFGGAMAAAFVATAGAFWRHRAKLGTLGARELSRAKAKLAQFRYRVATLKGRWFGTTEQLIEV